MYEALSYYCMRPFELLAFEAGSYQYMRPSDTSVCGLQQLVYEACSY